MSLAGHWSDRDYAGDRRRKKGEPRDNERAETVSTQPGTEERAILIGVGSVAPPTDHNLPMLDELAELARTAGARIVGRLYQRRDRPEPASYLGRGKVEELKELCREADANVVIADDDLAPSQVRHLEEWLDLRVIDRSELIIHIFAVHARTRQARLQVELAQAKYMAPRLKRMWTHLSRITGAGGIGSRGPGEKQIEVDRRIIQRRIADLTAELREIEGRRERQVGAREDVFKSALVGYTNAGKSTIMRRLTGADVLVADQLFATLDTRTRRWQLADVDILLSDTVGFIEKLPHHLVASFHATLEEVREADLLIHIVDAGDTEAEKKVKIVRSVLENIGANEIPELLVLNKIDLLPDPMEATILAGTMQTSLLVSAVTGQGFDLLEQTVHDRATSTFHTLDLRVPVRDGRTLALVRRVGRIVSERYEGDQCHVTASVPAASLGALRAFIQH
jgi:GTP-binding protein HflX